MVLDQLQQHQASFVKTVSDAMGWKDEDLRFPVEQHQNLSPAEQAQAEEGQRKAAAGKRGLGRGRAL